MNRRDFLTTLAAGAVAGCASTKVSKKRSTKKPVDRPNIVYLLNDHQLHYRHGWDEGPEIQRPNFKRLAADGAEFSRAYTACPLCSPARRTMLTGLMAHQHGQTRNDFHHPYDREVYLDHLREAGYRNYYYGKWHAGPGTAHDFGCEGFNYPSYSNPYNKPEYKEYLRKRGLPDPVMIVEQDYGFGPLEKGDQYLLKRRACLGPLTGVLETPDDTHEAFFLANLAVEKLQELAVDPSDEPFSLRVDFWGPHQPHFPTQRFIDLYDTFEIPRYPSFDDDLSDKPLIYKKDGKRPTTDENGLLIYPNPIPWEDWRKGMGYIYAHGTLVDAAGGLILDALDELGLAENTIVVWSTDHGDGFACHGGHFDKGCYLAEEVMRIPFAVRYPGVVPKGQVRNELVSNIDLAPTLLDAAGLSFDQPVDGESLLPLLTGQRDDWREDLLCATYGHIVPHQGRMLVADRYKYVINLNEKSELYDLETDPYELKNLIDSPEHQSIVKDLQSRMDTWREKTNDTQPVSTG